MKIEDLWAIMIIICWIVTTIYAAIFAYEMLSLVIDVRDAIHAYNSKGFVIHEIK